MPADYQSTARALSLPVSESEEQETPLFADDTRPPWTHSPLSSRRLSVEEAVSLRDRIINQAESTYRAVRNRWDKMTLVQKILASVGTLLLAAAGVAFMVLAGRIFTWLGPVADRWERSPLVYLVVWLLTFAVSFPPIVGWATLGTIAGFLFGFWKGWVVFTTATVIGSTISFVVCRTVLSSFVHRMLEHDKRFAALALTLKYDGLKLLCMIRLCPLPYSLCNGAISTFPTVEPLSYGLATALISPKFMMNAFIGSRIRLLSEDGEDMSAGSKAVNVISILVSVSVGVGTGIYIYRRTLARAKELEDQERAGIRHTLQDDHDAGRPHHGFSDDPNVNAAASTLARDEEERLGFHDIDEDNVDLVVDGDDIAESRGTKQYQDEFTDNDSDIFDDDDGEDVETYGLHTHVRQ